VQQTKRWSMCGAQSRSFVVAIWLAAALLIPSPSSAQQYIGLYLGGTIPLDADTTVTNDFRRDLKTEASADGVTLAWLDVLSSGTDFNAGAIVGGRVGLWLETINNPFLGLEAEVYGAFPKIADHVLTMEVSGKANGIAGTTTASIPIEEADLDLLIIGFNLLVRYPYTTIQPYGGVGVGIANAYLKSVKVREPTTVTIGGTSFSFEPGDRLFREDEDTALALQLIGGVRGFLNDNVALFAEYKYVKADFKFQSMELDYEANHIYGGIEYYFGPGVQKLAYGPPPPRWP